MANHYEVSVEDLLDIYERIDDEQAREKIRDILHDGERVPNLEYLYPTTYDALSDDTQTAKQVWDDIEDLHEEIEVDAGELVRELNGVEEPEDAKQWVYDEYGETHVHMTTYNGEKAPYVSRFVDELPPGWEFAESGEHPFGGEIVKA